MSFRSVVWLAALLWFTCGAQGASVIDPATDLFQRAERNLLEGKQEAAIDKLRVIVRSYEKSPFAPRAQLLIAELFSRNREFSTAFEAAQHLINHFPASDLFSEALEIQFTVAERVAEEYRRRRLKNDKSMQGLPDREVASQMFRIILANGPFSGVAPRAQYRLAIALDEEGQNMEATQEFNRFVENFGDHSLADDAAFQVAFIDYRLCRQNNRERGSQERARIAFDYFMVKFPQSEKMPEARYLSGLLQGWESERLLGAGDFYKRTGQKEPALKSYNDALRQAPGSAQADAAQKAIDKVKGREEIPATPSQ